MKRHILFVMLCVAVGTAAAQSFTVYQEGKKEVSFNEKTVDSIVFN